MKHNGRHQYLLLFVLVREGYVYVDMCDMWICQ